MVVTHEDVRRAVNEVIDPCSVRSGVAAGLVDMGLVSDVAVQGEAETGYRVSLSVGVTEPGCFMLGPFATSARERLLELPGVVDVSVSLRAWTSWSEEDMSESYRQRLTAERQVRRSLTLTLLEKDA